MATKLALFGASGNTGTAVLSLALSRGLIVKAMVRTPSKIKVEHDNLSLVQGTFDDTEKIAETVEGCDYVVSVAGGPMGNASKYPADLMLNFTKKLVPAIQQNSSIKCFLYQAGFLAANPSEQEKGGLPFGTWFARKTVARALEPNLRDHEAVMRYLKEGQSEAKYGTIVSNPPVLKQGEAKRALKPANSRSFGTNMGGVTFDELAVLTLDAIADESLYNKEMYIAL